MKIPIEALNQHTAILGKTGSGKTFTAKGFVERFLEDGRQVCIVDPTGAWWGMRSSADGKRAGFPILILGGEHGDVPLDPRSGAAVARMVTEQRANVILDTSGMSVSDQTRWFTDFASTLYRTIQSPLHLIIDEAHNFAPQGKVPDPQAGKMLHACNRLMSGGRSRGIRSMLITQRPAKLHKDSLTCCDTLVAMRVIAPQDRKAIKEWIDGCGNDDGRMVLDSLAQLQKGEGWAWYPEGGFLQRLKFPRIVTFDSSATPTGHGKAEPRTLAEIDLRALEKNLAESIEEARQNDPKELRAEITRLRKELAAAKREADPAEIAAAEARGRASAIRGVQGLHRELSETATGLEKQVRVFDERVGTLAASLRSLDTLLDGSASINEATANGHTPKAPRRFVAPAVERTDVAATTRQGSPESRIIASLAWWRAASVEQPTRQQVAFVAGYTVNGHFNNLCGRLKSQGLVDYPAGNRLALTSSAFTVEPDEPVTRDALIHRVRSVLRGEPQVRIFDALVRFGEPVAREALAESCGYTVNGHFNNIVGKLKSIGVVEYPGGGMVALSDVFEGVPE